jgi:hypothetical protein
MAPSAIKRECILPCGEVRILPLLYLALAPLPFVLLLAWDWIVAGIPFTT